MSRYYGGWQPYVSVAERRRKALRQMEKLRKAGKEIQPVEIAPRRPIANSFWGKGWCDHVESFHDLGNRLSRGRTYARNGSICHLAIDRGQVDAIVSGSSLYDVQIRITPLSTKKWAGIQKRCLGKIGSLIELLQGRLSDEIMSVVTDPDEGLFPGSRQISFECNCPDFARMCKHIAAVIYGIGARLDDQPELLFLLRDVDHQELINEEATTEALTASKGDSDRRRRTLASTDLSDVFGIELDEADEDRPPDGTEKKRPKKKAKANTTSRKSARPSLKKKTAHKPFQPTGPNVTHLRKKLGMTKTAFARAIGVSTPTIGNWEANPGTIHPHAHGLRGLRRLHRQAARKNP